MMINKISSILTVLFIVSPILLFGQNDDKTYDEFYKRVLDEEAYIGFFAAEKNCINPVDDRYLSARRNFFIGVSQSKEDPEEFGEPFLNFCKEKGYLKNGCEEEWEKVLTILSYELYVNMPIFEYRSDNLVEHRSIVFAEYPNKKLELDLFLPKSPFDEPVPAVVCIHGGGWTVNRRLWFEPFAQYLADKGFAAVTIDYRMLPAVTIMECVYDSKAAVRWVRANAEKYGIDPNRIGVIGASAGAQLVALLGATANVPELEGEGGNNGVSSEVQAVVGIATPAFIVGDSEEMADWFGIAPDDMKLLSPYENADVNSAPLFLIHGTVDDVVDPKDSQALYDKYKELGVHVELKWIPDEGHGFYEGTDIAIKMAADFFKSQFLK
jgi:acetyl esterase/lipase